MKPFLKIVFNLLFFVYDAIRRFLSALITYSIAVKIFINMPMILFISIVRIVFFIRLKLAFISRGSCFDLRKYFGSAHSKYFFVMKWLKGQECSNILFHFLLKSSLIFVTGFMDFILYLNCGISLTGCMDNNVVFIIIGFVFSIISEFIGLICFFDLITQYMLQSNSFFFQLDNFFSSFVLEFMGFGLNYDCLNYYENNCPTVVFDLKRDFYNFMTQDQLKKVIRSESIPYLKHYENHLELSEGPYVLRRAITTARFNNIYGIWVPRVTVIPSHIFDQTTWKRQTVSPFVFNVQVRDDLGVKDAIIHWPIYRHFVPRDLQAADGFFQRFFGNWFNTTYMKCYDFLCFLFGKTSYSMHKQEPVFLSLGKVRLPVQNWRWYEEIYPLVFVPNGKSILFDKADLTNFFSFKPHSDNNLLAWEATRNHYANKEVVYENVSEESCLARYSILYKFILDQKYRFASYGSFAHYFFVNSIVTLAANELYAEMISDLDDDQFYEFEKFYPLGEFHEYVLAREVYANSVDTWFFHDLPRHLYSRKFAKQHGYFDPQFTKYWVRQFEGLIQRYEEADELDWAEHQMLYALWEKGLDHDVLSPNFDHEAFQNAIWVAVEILKREIIKEEEFFADMMMDKLRIKNGLNAEEILDGLQDYTPEERDLEGLQDSMSEQSDE